MAAEDQGDRYEVEVRYDVRVPTADPRVTLSVDVFRPMGAGPVPALVSAYPYRKDRMGVAHGPLLRWFAERGYASVLVDLRGTGSSDGRYCEFDPVEGEDAVGVIEWAAAQPWCDGSVGMWGHSYGALMTMRAASLRPAALKAIIPVQGPVDPERYVVHPDGARGDLHALVLRGGLMLAGQLLPSLLNYTSVEEQRRWRERLADPAPVFMDFARHGAGDPVWQRRAIDATAITTPALCIGGWRDVHCEGLTRAYEQLSGPKKLLMGPWAHTLPHASPVEPVDFPSIALRWWDRWLRGVDNGVMDEPPVTLYLGEETGWQGFASWPPAKSELVLATGTDTTLAEPDLGTVPEVGVVGVYEPDPTAGVLSGMWGTGFSDTGPHLDQHDDDLRGLSFTSEPLGADLLVCGRPEVSVRLPELPAAGVVRRLVVRLAQVDPQDRSTFITGGVLCPTEPSEVHRVVLRATGCRVRAGQRLRVVVSDADFPRLMPVADPSPIPVAGVEVVVPTVPDEAGSPVAMSYAATPAGGLVAARPDPTGGQRRLIIRDPIHDGIEVAFASSTPGLPTPEGHLVEAHTDVRASVRRGAPDAAVTSGTHTTVARMNTGETISVTVALRCTQTTLWAHGEVTIDDLTVFSQTWDALL